MTTIVFKTLGDLEQRGKSMCVDVILKDGQILPLYTSYRSHYDDLVVNKFLRATCANIVASDTGISTSLIRLTKNSEISRGQIFEPDSNATDAFFNAPSISVAQAVTESPYKRFSVSGTIKAVSPLKTTTLSKRKVVELEDTMDNSKKVRLNLWKEVAEQDIPPENTPVVIKNVYPKVFADQLSLNSTQYTTIKVVKSNNTLDIVVQGFKEKADGYLQLQTDESKLHYKVHSTLLLNKLNVQDLDDFQKLLPLTISITYAENPNEKVVSQVNTFPENDEEDD